MANDPPVIKPWGKFNKKILQELIDEGKVDIACASDSRYIDRLRLRNFCRNFRSYARSRQLEDEVSGYRRRQENDDDEEVDDDEVDNDEDNDDEIEDNDDEENDATMTKATASKKKAPSKKKGGVKTTGEEEPIDVDSPPPTKKQRATLTCFFGGVPPPDAQPQVSLLPGGRMLSIQWKTSEKLFLDLQAAVQGIPKNSSRYTGYSDTTQVMVNAGVRAIDGYHRGAPQLIHLDRECTGNPKIKMFQVPTKKKVSFAGMKHMQFNCMYVITLKVASDRHALTAQPKNGGIADFGFLESQSSTEVNRGVGGGGGGGGGGGRGRGGGGGGQVVKESSEEENSVEKEKVREDGGRRRGATGHGGWGNDTDPTVIQRKGPWVLIVWNDEMRREVGEDTEDDVAGGIDVDDVDDVGDDDESSSSPPHRRDHHRNLIGGPGTSLPHCVESALAWGLCLMCLAVSGYHYCKSISSHRYYHRSPPFRPGGWWGWERSRRAFGRGIYSRARRLVVRGMTIGRRGWTAAVCRVKSTHHRSGDEDDDDDDDYYDKDCVGSNHQRRPMTTRRTTRVGGHDDDPRRKPPRWDDAGMRNDDPTTSWIPLTTHSRSELDRISPHERYLTLRRLLESKYPEVLLPRTTTAPSSMRAMKDECVDDDRSSTSINPEDDDSNNDENDDEDDDDNDENDDADYDYANQNSLAPLRNEADVALVGVLRRDGICRRLASLAMRPYNPSTFDITPTTMPSSSSDASRVDDDRARTRTPANAMTTLIRQYPNDELLRRLTRLWRHFLVLPSVEETRSYRSRPLPPSSDGDGVVPIAVAVNEVRINDDAVNDTYRISLIVPAYQEKGSHLRIKLLCALEKARDPNGVEVVIVDAGRCSELESLLLPPAGGGRSVSGVDACDGKRFWGRLSIFAHVSGGGRGPCLNFGASVASGRILTFCHSDTMLPLHWDDRIVRALDHDNYKNDDELIASNVARANSCAFSFGIDTSKEGLSMPFEGDPNSTTPYFPPGIKAVETTANLRTYLYSLPYGDQVLSMHACIFHFLGGFPNQCLMEDYELVSLLRRRAALFTVSHTPGLIAREELVIIQGDPALCSPRRWQKFGVLYVTYMNSKFVNLYSGTRKMNPAELFQLYYGKAPPARCAAISPWELELANQLKATCFK
ncbi:hypothetical protein ACHAXA_011594 [Cyclostephanos tholiformis]|uniref:Glycosyltransferase 2-like domain-containing protein n=1 Tax=Cyclostephanos tholiformis TaxID=382380 RepID=A0ABD3SHN0_9STRA